MPRRTADEAPGAGRFAPLLRALPFLLPALIVVPAAYFIIHTAWLAVHEPFGRDQGIFQYVSFALSKGDRDYVAMHEINGPLVHLLYFLLYKLGGQDELVIRAVDFAITAVVFFGVGWVVPGIGWIKGDAPSRPTTRARLAWAALGSVMMWAYYLRFNWWDHTQRESFYNLFILASLSLQLAAQVPSGTSDKRRLWMLAVAGALGALPSFGKPTCALYWIGQLAGLWLDHDAPLARRRRVGAFVLGAVVGAVPVLVYVAIYAAPGAMVQAVLFDGPRLYRHIWHKSFAEGYGAWNNAPGINYGIASCLVTIPLMALRVLPRRTIGAVVFLWAGMASFVLQGKMFPYHLYPVTCAMHLVWLYGLAVIAERAPRNGLRVPPLAATALAIAFSGFFVWRVFDDMTHCQTAAEFTAERLEVSRTFDGRMNRLPKYYNGGDYFPWDIRRAGWFIRDHTDPSERAQVYGMDPYVLFFAERLSATPFLYSFEFNVDAAVAGGSGGVPSPSDVAWLRAKQSENARTLFETMKAKPPAAFVSIDNQPFSYPKDADVDFEAHCPDAAKLVKDGYTRVRRFGGVRVWLRNDLASNVPPPGPGEDGT